MQQLLIAVLLLLCMLTIYVLTIAGEHGLHPKQQRTHEHTMNYVREIDA